jgi:hypothetical protein
MKKTLVTLVLAVSALVSVSAHADAGDRPDQVFPAVAVPSTPAHVPAVTADANLPANFVNVYFGN